jgi:hypothetical protein
MRALMMAVVYFGTFLSIGYVGKRLLDKWMARHGEHLNEVQAQGKNGGSRGHDRFLLGTWYKDR